ncbi:hypothetical protein PFAG_00985 [Plasmodium falciparum Santa Lucia]|uniref:AKAP-like protein n=16 Tax=Plasmodium falciparum TaxID=5833 RepID=Q8I3X8_PLAF7|nr:AKAP-like protein [Plasmodium falciparum 3D7]ETW20130.1 hypothetical protein PFFVO_01031 [Plasmodium falciparum Vietnam Oak-Knoll (FVO)]ETW31866.1 hypothetical protein PFFCH_00650 [Plasmodium falciparum FCH/4]ETW38170.1 hypothetical protein PFTANZ_01131 [Plasmodium falciparum Tanzania (2000708)]ETW44553.1 hypothetical protein PFNF135_01121 [Plasmodium falciparum NF135/5.C10]ETW50935.1 hypothetical protein PFMALIP_01094 [Plasmodium falciparum MaliPS096_E11]ETW53510.1 hypothetical protein PF|eukprot:XP_001351686.1 conserved Plasmodium protein, unknown function [Plasmodium falciparum 3D7]
MNIKRSIYHYLSYSSFLIKNHYHHNNTIYPCFHSLRNNNKMSYFRPNYFICIPIKNDNICNELINIQKHVLVKYDELKDCIIERNKFHISLLILHIKKNQIELSKEAFNEAMEKIKKNMHNEKICFEKLDTFRNDVLYLSLKEDSNKYIINIINHLIDSFSKRGIKIIFNNKKPAKEILSNNNKKELNKNSNDLQHITPHLTLMKNSYMKKMYMNKKPQILPFFYTDYDLTNLLKEQIDIQKIQFLEMDMDTSTSYYKIVSEFNL